jgi:replicative DNA helicase
MALVATTQIPTSNNWVQMGDLMGDDVVFDHLGRPTKIKTIQHYMPTECYEVEFDDGLVIRGDKNLTLCLQDRVWRNCLTRYKNYPATKKRRTFSRPLIKKAVPDIEPIRIGSRLNYSVPNCLPVQFAHRDLPVPPYIFGVWFASLTPKGRLWLRDKPLNKMQRIFRNYGHGIKTTRHKNGHVMFDIRPSIASSFLFSGLNPPTNLPFFYLDGSIGQRTELIEGLIDGGFIKKYKNSNLYVAKNANYHLMRKIQGLVESLGVKTTLHTPANSASFTLKFRMEPDFSVLHGANRRFVVNITQIPPQPCVHVDTEGQFLVGEGFIPVC